MPTKRFIGWIRPAVSQVHIEYEAADLLFLCICNNKENLGTNLRYHRDEAITTCTD